MTKITKFKT